jgi:4-amino-4-deoxy-L-arabinose transferase-like glycosyltransferase
MVEKKKFFKLALLIAFLALFLRLYRLGQNPISLHWDEASWGYNAWSILKTGRDEYGKIMPLIFKAFGDYKAPIYVYLTSLSIAIFGLSEFAIRFPAALFGALNVFLLSIFVRRLFKGFKAKETVALFSSLILAFSPWHYDFSHGAWEANILFSLYLLGLIFFLKSLKKSKYLFYSGLFFALCFYVYASAKLILPLTGLGLLAFFGKKLFQKVKLKKIFSAGFLVFLFILPVIYFTFFKGAGGRLKIMSVFSYARPQEEAQLIAEIENTKIGSLRYNLFNNNFHYFFRSIFLRYLNHFSPRFLFFEGGWNDYRHGIPDFGVLNYLDFALLFLGAYFLLSKRVKNQGFIWFLLAIAPLPAALTRDIIQSLRAYFMVLPLSIISAFGFYYLARVFPPKKPLLKTGLLTIFAAIYLFVFGLFWDRYFIHAAWANSQYWQYGYKEAVQFIKERVNQYEKIVFTAEYGQPYIYYLLYSQYEPSKYQKQARLIEHPEGDVGYVERIDQIEFKNLYWPRDRSEKGVLYIGAAYEIPDHDLDPNQARVLKDIYFLNGDLAFRIVETLK